MSTSPIPPDSCEVLTDTREIAFVPTLPKSAFAGGQALAFLPSAPLTDISQSTTFEKKYHIEIEMGTGKYGTVYKVIQKNTGRVGDKQYFAAKKMFQKQQDQKQHEQILRK